VDTLAGSGNPVKLDPTAKSAARDLPAFLARPAGAPVYHGFPIVEETRKDGWVFGTITDYELSNGGEWGDAFVIAPDGSRAGIVWATDELAVHEVCPPSEDRWGVYGFGFPKPIRTTADFVECCHGILPELQRIFASLRGSNRRLH
jgi:hypothetical protein